MRAWDDIVNKALLGTEKAPPDLADLPSPARDLVTIELTGNREDDFMRLAALTWQFRQSGAIPMDFKTLSHSVAEPETWTYCNQEADSTLRTTLQEDLPEFLTLWLQLCHNRKQLVWPERIPRLFEITARRKNLRSIVREVCGKRGEWLSLQNPQWNYAVVADEKNTWETGAPDERRALLFELRTTDPEAGRKLLQSTWAAEGANEKTAFLEIMRRNLSESDLEWLESLKEKAQKVNVAVMELLKAIPASTMVRDYTTLAMSIIKIKTGKALLGLLNTEAIVIDDTIIIPENIFKTGIEKLSSTKNVSDHQFVLAQIIAFVPPSAWCTHFSKNTDETVDLFEKEKRTAFFLPALADAAVRFRAVDWARTLLKKAAPFLTNENIASLIQALPENERDGYAQEHLTGSIDEIVRIMVENEAEWSLSFTRALFKHTASQSHQYNRPFYRWICAHIPVTILDELDNFTPDDENKKAYWKNQRDELARLLSIKQQILKSFHV